MSNSILGFGRGAIQVALTNVTCCAGIVPAKLGELECLRIFG